MVLVCRPVPLTCMPGSEACALVHMRLRMPAASLVQSILGQHKVLTPVVRRQLNNPINNPNTTPPTRGGGRPH